MRNHEAPDMKERIAAEEQYMAGIVDAISSLSVKAQAKILKRFCKNSSARVLTKVVLAWVAKHGGEIAKLYRINR